MLHVSRSLRALLLPCAAASAAAQTVVISDTFEVDSRANYVIVDDSSPDGTQTFAWDYVSAGLPLAPRSAPGTARGLRLTANDAATATDAWTLFHTTPVSAPFYRLEVDVWMNFDTFGPSTEHAHIGVGGDGVTFNSIFSPVSGSGVHFAFDGDGDTASDYRWYRDLAHLPNGETDIGTIPATHPSYLGHGSNNTHPFFQALFPSPPATRAGSPGNIWTTVRIDVDNAAGVVEMYFDGVLTFQGNFANPLVGLTSLGLCDLFASVSGPANVFTVYDNFVVTTFAGPVGSSYCAAVANSTGNPGAIGATGVPVAASNDVLLRASALPSNAFGFFLTSQTQGTVNQPGGSQGILCLGGAIGRYVGPGQIKNSGAAGAFELRLDLTRTPTPSGLVAVSAGQTWNYQAWYRDSVGGSATSNFTNGVTISYQ